VVGATAANKIVVSVSNALWSPLSARDAASGWSASGATISSAAKNGNLITLTLADDATSSDVITLAYDASAGSIADSSPFSFRQKLFSITSLSVTNNVSRPSEVDLCAGIVCSAVDACHVAGTCNPLDGLCTPGATICACTVDADCPAIDPCHGPGSCDTATGMCVDFVALPCDDLDECAALDADCTRLAGEVTGGCSSTRSSGTPWQAALVLFTVWAARRHRR
jgi:hypothetical protein